MTQRKFWLLALTICVWQLSPLYASAATDDPAAHVSKLDGKAFAASTGGVTRQLRMNDRLYEQERIITGKDAEVELKFTDDTEISLGAGTVVTVDSYRFKKQADTSDAASESSFGMSILRGTVRAFTGLLAKRRPRSVSFRTAVATIGIRGTHFAAEVEGDSATIILLAQQDPKASNAIEVENAYGKVEIDKAGWGTEIPDAASPPSPPRKMQSTQSMNRIIRSVQTTRRVVVPRSPMR